MDDTAVAAIIAAEAARRRQFASSAALAWRDAPTEPDPPAELNKRYLGAVVSAVVGHNRRNQEEQSWRQRGLDSRP